MDDVDVVCCVDVKETVLGDYLLYLLEIVQMVSLDSFRFDCLGFYGYLVLLDLATFAQE